MASVMGEPVKSARSLSICAPTSASMEALAASASPSTPSAPRRRPAARSQSARIAASRSVRRRPPPQAHAQGSGGSGSAMRDTRGRYSSEPRLTEAETPPLVRRQTSARRRPQQGAASAHNPQHRKSAAFLDVPRYLQQSTTDDEPDEDSYRLRTFNVTNKGGIVNRGDSFRRRHSRSGSLAPTAQTSPASIVVAPDPRPAVSDNGVRKANVIVYTVAMIGAPGVGKTALASQFQTSECINAYDRQRDASTDQRVSIMLNGEESELNFVNIANSKDEIDRSDPPDAFVVIYSVVDKASFQRAEQELARLADAELLRTRPAILAANKIDLARSRAVSTQDGKCLACTYKAKFIEVSVGINHNVDELLVGILHQIRLKKDRSSNGADGRDSHWYKSRGVVRASMKARQMFTWVFGKEDSKFKNCENLHVL